MKRLFDIFFSAIAFAILLLLFLKLMFLLRVTAHGEVFFLKKGVRRGDSHFKLYKFATMLKNSPNICAGTVAVHDHPRLLPSGRFLHKTKIDELPQLINIFNVDMSVISPRRQTKSCFNAFPVSLHKETHYLLCISAYN